MTDKSHVRVEINIDDFSFRQEIEVDREDIKKAIIYFSLCAYEQFVDNINVEALIQFFKDLKVENNRKAM